MMSAIVRERESMGQEVYKYGDQLLKQADKRKKKKEKKALLVPPGKDKYRAIPAQ